METLHLPEHMNFRACDPSKSHHQNNHKIVVLFSWTNARDVHLEKYRSFWTSRNYDILTIRTSSSDRLIPPLNIRKNALGLIKFFREHSNYDKVLFHVFSVGNTAAFEFMQYLTAKFIEPKDPENYEISKRILASIKGLIIDSITFVDGNANGIAKSLSDNCFIQFLLRQFVFIYEHLTMPMTLSHYRALEVKIFQNPLKLPGLFLYSKDDQICDYRQMDNLVARWKSNAGLLVRHKCWDHSGHCQHFKYHPEDYAEEVDIFLKDLAQL